MNKGEDQLAHMHGLIAPFFNPLYSGNPYNEYFANSEDPDEMQHFDRVYTVKLKKFFRQMKTIFFESYILTPLGVYNVLSQVSCIKPEGKIH